MQVEFPEPVTVAEIHIKFQGGFAGRDCWIEGSTDSEGQLLKLATFYPEDINSLQVSFIT